MQYLFNYLFIKQAEREAVGGRAGGRPVGTDRTETDREQTDLGMYVRAALTASGILRIRHVRPPD